MWIMIINNCPKCGRLLFINDGVEDIYTCPICETKMSLNWEIITDEDGEQREVLFLEEIKNESRFM